jgi:hypothetical protein
MHKSRSFIITASAAFAALFVTASVAEAQNRVKRTEQSRPLTVKKRSFLDAGNVVPVGSESRYVTNMTQLGRPMPSYNQPSRYGVETLPGRFGVFGN